jgi:hypothetical protein
MYDLFESLLAGGCSKASEDLSEIFQLLFGVSNIDVIN